MSNTSNVKKATPKPKITFRRLVYLVVKRIIDFSAGLFGSILLIPITIIVQICRTINHEKGPLFYDQLRIGKNGEVFKLYKFRSMVVGADEVLKTYLETHHDEAKEYKKYKKLKKDPRVTKSGEFLRKTSLDEWPQFINVLRGNMSLVGPRPYLLREKEDMGEYYDKIIKATPGLTGPWQIAGRSNVTFNDRLRIDNDYIDKLSLKNDIIIVLKTIGKVFKSDGAI